jgi:hypothetical protein
MAQSSTASSNPDTPRKKLWVQLLKLWHRHRIVQMRTRIMNQLQVVALNEGVRRKKALEFRRHLIGSSWARLPTLQSFFPFRSKLLHTAARFPGRPLGAREAVSAPIDAAFEIEDWLH